jgi:hypothetical protein
MVAGTELDDHWSLFFSFVDLITKYKLPWSELARNRERKGIVTVDALKKALLDDVNLALLSPPPFLSFPSFSFPPLLKSSVSLFVPLLG